MKHPLELFQNDHFKNLIQKVRQSFDHIIIDTPPIIPVSDSVLISKYCDIKLFVVSAGQDTLNDVKQAVKKANNHAIKIDGFIFNHQKSSTESQYQYRYSYANSTS